MRVRLCSNLEVEVARLLIAVHAIRFVTSDGRIGKPAKREQLSRCSIDPPQWLSRKLCICFLKHVILDILEYRKSDQTLANSIAY